MRIFFIFIFSGVYKNTSFIEIEFIPKKLLQPLHQLQLAPQKQFSKFEG